MQTLRVPSGHLTSATTPGASSNLAADYPRMEIPSALRSAVADALRGGETHYTLVGGVAQLRQEVASALQDAGIAVGEDQVLLTAGEQESRFLALQSLRRSGKTIGLPDVVDPGARRAALLRDGQTVPIAVDASTMTVTAASVQAALDAGAQAIYLENPGRLSGKLLPPAELMQIAALVCAADAWVVVDEGLGGWLPPSTTFTPLATLPGMAERTLTLGLPWPGLGLEPWSLAYLCGPEAQLDACRTLKQVISICTNTISQWGSAGGQAVYLAEHASRMTALQTRYQDVLDVCTATGWDILPGDALATVALRLPEDVRAQLLAAGVVGSDGGSFGMPDVIRLAVEPDGATASALRAVVNGRSS